MVLEEHYKPQGPTDRCPTNPLSVIVALADKIDTLCGFFSIGEKPTGSKDPFALRRSALGVIRLILENKLSLNLKALLGQEDLYAFILDRFKVILKEREIPHGIVSACLGDKSFDLKEIEDKIYVLNQVLSEEKGDILRTVFSRTANILKDVIVTGNPSPALFEKSQEKDLFEAFSRIESIVDYRHGFQALLTLSLPLTTFFDQVTVNDENLALRENRLKLLTQIRDFALKFADLHLI